MTPKSDSLVWKPSDTETAKKLQTACEVSAITLHAGAGGAHISLYNAVDANGATESELKWTIDCSAQSDDNVPFTSPIVFTKGVYAVCVTGFNFNPELCLAWLKYNS